MKDNSLIVRELKFDNHPSWRGEAKALEKELNDLERTLQASFVAFLPGVRFSDNSDKVINPFAVFRKHT